MSDLLARAGEALWEAWMGQHKIAGGKEYASFADLHRWAEAGQEPAKHYLAAIEAEVIAVANVLLTEPPTNDMLNVGAKGAHIARRTAFEAWCPMARALRLSLVPTGSPSDEAR